MELKVCKFLMKFLAFFRTKSTLTCSHQPTPCQHYEQKTHFNPSLYFIIYFDMNVPSTPRYFKRSFSFRFSFNNLYIFFFYLIIAT